MKNHKGDKRNSSECFYSRNTFIRKEFFKTIFPDFNISIAKSTSRLSRKIESDYFKLEKMAHTKSSFS